MSLTPEERETVINTTDADGSWRIWSCRRTDITRMRNHQGFTEVASGEHEGTPWAEFRIDQDRWNPATGVKRQLHLSDERRAALAERLKATRERSSVVQNAEQA